MTAREGWQPQPLPLLTHAVAYADGDASCVPAQNQFVELLLSPKASAAGS
jgi:hypothetical protein